MMPENDNSSLAVARFMARVVVIVGELVTELRSGARSSPRGPRTILAPDSPADGPPPDELTRQRARALLSRHVGRRGAR